MIYALRHSLSPGLSLNMASLTFTYSPWVACINCIYACFSLISAHGPKKMKQSVISKFPLPSTNPTCPGHPAALFDSRKP